MSTTIRCAAIAVLILTGCGDDDHDDTCMPGRDLNCVCARDVDPFDVTSCEDGRTPDGDPCSCEVIQPSTCGDGQCDATEDADGCPADCETPDDPEPDGHRFLMLVDGTTDVASEYPGADIDAIELIKSDGARIFATTVEDANIPAANNAFADPSQVVGPTDAACNPDSAAFASLGGADAGAYVTVSFGPTTDRSSIQNGDTIRLYELSNDNCGDFGDDVSTVTVALVDGMNFFAELGELGPGEDELIVQGLE